MGWFLASQIHGCVRPAAMFGRPPWSLARIAAGPEIALSCSGRFGEELPLRAESALGGDLRRDFVQLPTAAIHEFTCSTTPSSVVANA
jgi:hypothetical protein